MSNLSVFKRSQETKQHVRDIIFCSSWLGHIMIRDAQKHLVTTGRVIFKAGDMGVSSNKHTDKLASFAPVISVELWIRLIS